VERMMISILIPVHNYDIIALVHSMRDGLERVPEYGEILIGDNGSSPDFRNKYLQLEGAGIRVIVSEKNIGRAAIRNRLALEAKGDYLLYIDADTMIQGTAEAYLLAWLPLINTARVIYGGISYAETAPGDPDKMLRWKYGRKNEQLKASERNKHPHSGFSTFNVMIEKSVFSKLRFNEELKKYGHEDTLLGYQLKKAGIGVIHIDNTLIHEGLESNRAFINKTKLGIENLSHLYDKVTDKKTFTSCVPLLRTYHRLSLLRMTRLLAGIYINYRDRIEIRLDSANTSLFLFKLYRITLFCTYREIHRRKQIIPIF
jgi:glycosyltransferase involved in cell wall biosynthesis